MDNDQFFRKSVKGLQNAMFCMLLPASEQYSATGAAVTAGIFPP